MEEYITKKDAQKCLEDLSSENLLGTDNNTFISLPEALDRLEELDGIKINIDDTRKIVREEIARAAKLWCEEVAHYEKMLVTPDGNVWYGRRPATLDEKFELFLKLLEEPNEETL